MRFFYIAVVVGSLALCSVLVVCWRRRKASSPGTSRASTPVVEAATTRTVRAKPEQALLRARTVQAWTPEEGRSLAEEIISDTSLPGDQEKIGRLLQVLHGRPTTCGVLLELARPFEAKDLQEQLLCDPGIQVRFLDPENLEQLLQEVLRLPPSPCNRVRTAQYTAALRRKSGVALIV
jgi:hypothetical protein